MDRDYILSVVLSYCPLFEENLEYLSRLDSAIGDGDHGITMVRGFKSVNEYFSNNSPENYTISHIMETTGKIVLKAMGGSCGPLYSIFFMKGAAAVKDKKSWDVVDLYSFFNAGANGIMSMGKARAGDKTMLDALLPAVESLKESADKRLDIFSAINIAAEAAAKGRDATKDMLSSRGRGRYCGELSVGHIDPGAASMTLIVKSFVKK